MDTVERTSHMSLRTLNKYVKKMRLTDGCIVMIRKDSDLAKEVDDLSRILGQTKLRDIVIVIVDDFDEISIRDSKQMNDLGWYKLPSMRSKKEAQTDEQS